MGRRIDITGLRKGKLVAVKINSQDKNKRFLWFCKCDCGGEKILRMSTFKEGKITSCGCERVSHNRHNDRKYAIIKNLYNSTIKKRSKKWKDGQFITLAEFEKLSFEKCFYCGCEPSQKISDRSFRPTSKSLEYIFVNGIDRINSNIGYIQGNVRSCCSHCNTAKNSLSENEFKNLINNIYKHWILK